MIKALDTETSITLDVGTIERLAQDNLNERNELLTLIKDAKQVIKILIPMAEINNSDVDFSGARSILGKMNEMVKE